MIAISDHIAVRKIIQIARHFNPNIYIIVRTQFVAEIDELLRLGADEVVPEEFEASIELFSKVLEFYKIPKNVINELVEEIKSGHYEALRTEDKRLKISYTVKELWKLINFKTLSCERGSFLVGQSIKRLDLRAKTGATIVAIQRGEELILNPAPNETLLEGDILFIMGSEDQLRRVFKYLEYPLDVMY